MYSAISLVTRARIGDCLRFLSSFIDYDEILEVGFIYPLIQSPSHADACLLFRRGQNYSLLPKLNKTSDVTQTSFLALWNCPLIFK